MILTGVMPPGNYFSAELESGKVARGKVTKVDRIKRTAHVTLIDYGQQLFLPWQKLVPLDTQFWNTKAQALKIQLDGFVSYHNVDVLEFVKKKLVGRRVFGREVNPCLSQTVPLVNIFEADPKGDLMFVENLREQMREVNLGDLAPAKGRSALGSKITINNNISDEKTPAGSLQQPRLPEVEEFYDCFVVEVVSAEELYVQPYENLVSLNNLNRQMIAFYSANGGSPIQSSEPGNEFPSVSLFLSDRGLSFPRSGRRRPCWAGLVQGSDCQEVGLLVGLLDGQQQLPGETCGHRESGDRISGSHESLAERVPLPP